MKRYTRLQRIALYLPLLLGMITRADIHSISLDEMHAKLVRALEMRFCYITFVKVEGDEYLIKQKKSRFLRKIVGVVRDALTAHIAESFNADLAHKVRILGVGKKFPGKPRVDWPATIHTVAPGKMVKAQNSAYNRLDIKQADIGFQRPMLAWMAKHPTLTMMVALDTFLCNHDRHRGNLFYDAKRDSFCAIDMDSAWKHNLCALALKFFKHLASDKRVRLTPKEIRTLRMYKKHLEFLIEQFKPEDTLALYNQFVEEAGFIKGSPLYSEKIALELDRNRRMIKESYGDVKKLIPVLEQLIKTAKRNLKISLQ